MTPGRIKELRNDVAEVMPGPHWIGCEAEHELVAAALQLARVVLPEALDEIERLNAALGAAKVKAE